MPSYCVTGATGFIASYLVKSLLLQGHTVRATVRDPDNVEKVGFLWELQGAKERLTLYKADLLVDGSFDDAINGVDGVFHTACPVFLPTQTDDVQTLLIDPGIKGTLNVLSSCKKANSVKRVVLTSSCSAIRYRDERKKITNKNVQTLLIDPGIKGTLNVLSSCKKANSVKRVVLTSSCSAIRYRDDASLVSPLNESHWSDPEYCKRYNLWYAYAKTLGEKAAWEVAKESGLDLVAVNPSFVVGPLLTSQPTSTLELILSLTKGAIGEYPKQVIGFVHIDDVIAAHILAMEETKASGRLICSSSVANWSDVVKMLKDKYPMYPFESKQGSTEGNDFPHSMDTSKIMQLGFPGFKSIPQMFDDCIKSFQEKGFL